MIDELQTVIKEYQMKWQKLVAKQNDIDFFKALKPTSVGWKTEDLPDFLQRLEGLRELCDQIHLGWINERWLATLHLKKSLPWDIQIIKLMQRRPESTDAVGLDHLDFFIPEGKNAKAVVEKENLKWTEEKNGAHCRWISIWFDDTEAKLRSDTVLDVCAAELKEVEAELLDRLKA